MIDAVHDSVIGTAACNAKQIVYWAVGCARYLGHNARRNELNRAQRDRTRFKVVGGKLAASTNAGGHHTCFSSAGDGTCQSASGAALHACCEYTGAIVPQPGQVPASVGDQRYSRSSPRDILREDRQLGARKTEHRSE